MRTLGILFPIKETSEGGVFMPSRSTDQALRSDLIALLTLRRGQRPMQSNMYSPVYDYVMEPLDSVTETELDKKIKDKIKEYIPQIDVKKIIFTPKEGENQNYLTIKIIYSIVDFFDINETLTLEIPTQF